MKVGIVGIGGGAVGMTTYQRTLLEGLSSRTNHDVSFIAPDAEVAYTLPRSGPFRAFTNFVGTPDPRVRAALRAAHADVYIVNAAWPMPRGLRRSIAIVAEAVVDEAPAWGVQRSSQKRLAAKYLYRALDGASGIVAISEFTRDRLHEATGVALENITIAPPALLGFDGDATTDRSFAPYVTVVGWFHPRKDLPLALRAWRRAIERGLDRDLVLVGQEGPDDRRYGSVARRILEIAGPDLASRVHHTGPVPRPELGKILERTDAVLITSSYEGFGIPAIEAFSFGKPVVAVDAGSLRDVVPPHGVVTTREPDAIADQLIRVVQSPPDPAPLVAYARSFSVERQVRPVIGLLDRLS
jgi:glycosyltransferase involved in cell wall biosynthesis